MFAILPPAFALTARSAGASAAREISGRVSRMTRVIVLVLVAMLLQPLRPAAQAPAELYPILFVHGFCSSADTWSVMTAALTGANPVALRDDA